MKENKDNKMIIVNFKKKMNISSKSNYKKDQEF